MGAFNGEVSRLGRFWKSPVVKERVNEYDLDWPNDIICPDCFGTKKITDPGMIAFNGGVVPCTMCDENGFIQI